MLILEFTWPELRHPVVLFLQVNFSFFCISELPNKYYPRMIMTSWEPKCPSERALYMLRFVADAGNTTLRKRLKIHFSIIDSKTDQIERTIRNLQFYDGSDPRTRKICHLKIHKAQNGTIFYDPSDKNTLYMDALCVNSLRTRNYPYLGIFNFKVQLEGIQAFLAAPYEVWIIENLRHFLLQS